MSKATSLPGSRTRPYERSCYREIYASGNKNNLRLRPSGSIRAAFEPVTEKLRNISSRGIVQTGENVLIAGLIVGGNALATNAVVLRAIGPSLSASGIANPLQNPMLELRNSSGV